MKRDAFALMEKLRAAGLRVTPQRRAVWATFRDGRSGHLTAEEVCERARRELPELARATVYNALADLVRVGLLREVQGHGAVRYDPNLDPDHHHFLCVICGTLDDIHVAGVDGLRLVAAEGFSVTHRSVLFEGRCPRCARKSTPTVDAAASGVSPAATTSAVALGRPAPGA